MADDETPINISRWANVRLNEEEHRALEIVQGRLQTTRSRLLRKVIRELIRQGPDLLDQEWKAFENLAFQLAAVGRNLNQLMKAVHTGKVAMTSEDQALIGEIREKVDQARKEVIAAVDRSCNRWVDGFR